MLNIKYALLHTALTLATLSTILSTASAVSTVKLSLFYESQCPFCMNFFTQQLGNTFEKIGQSMEIDLLPYGNAEHEKLSNGSYTFTCQHGADECRYNKIHSCAIKYTPETKKLVKFLSCLMKVRDEDQVIHKCARKSKVQLSSIIGCAKSEEGSTLLATYGERTHNYKFKNITFVPTIVFNDKYDDDDQSQAEECLLKVVCKYLDPKPDVCAKENASVIHIT